MTLNMSKTSKPSDPSRNKSRLVICLVLPIRWSVIVFLVKLYVLIFSFRFMFPTWLCRDLLMTFKKQVHPYMIPIDRLTVSRWKRARTDPGTSVRFLEFSKEIIFIHYIQKCHNKRGILGSYLWKNIKLGKSEQLHFILYLLKWHWHPVQASKDPQCW